MTFFAAENLAINFGGIRALDGVSFEVDAGQVFTIIGPNGAGKTTIFNLVSRIYDPSQGRLTFCGEDITRVAPHEIAGRGIARTFQNIELFEHATVLQNLLLGRHAHKRSRFAEELLFLPRIRALGARASRGGREDHRFPRPHAVPRQLRHQPALRRAQGGGDGARPLHRSPSCSSSTSPPRG